jgi:hypothetical protein
MFHSTEILPLKILQILPWCIIVHYFITPEYVPLPPCDFTCRLCCYYRKQKTGKYVVRMASNGVSIIKIFVKTGPLFRKLKWKHKQARRKAMTAWCKDWTKTRGEPTKHLQILNLGIKIKLTGQTHALANLPQEKTQSPLDKRMSNLKQCSKPTAVGSPRSVLFNRGSANSVTPLLILSWDSVLGIATRYWIDGLGFESRQRQKNFLFSKIIYTSTGPHPASYLMSTRVLSRGFNGRRKNMTTHLHQCRG